MNLDLDELREKFVGMDIDQTVKTDAEINAEAEAEWMGILASLWVAIGKPVDPDRLRIYAEDLWNIPLGLLELAVKRVRREQTWNIVPLAGEILTAVNRELDAANVPDIQGWLEKKDRYLMQYSGASQTAHSQYISEEI